MSNQPTEVMSSPGQLSKRFLPLSNADWIVLGCAAAWTMYLTVSLGNIGFFLGLVIAGCLLWSLSWGKLYDRILSTIYDVIWSFAKHGVFWENVELLKKEGVYVKPPWWRRALSAVVYQQHPYPLAIDSLELDGNLVGIGNNFNQGTDSMVFVADGSDISRYEPADRIAALTEFGSALKRLTFAFPVTVTLIVRPRPPQDVYLEEDLLETLHPEVMYPVYLEHARGIDDADRLHAEGKITDLELRHARLSYANVYEAMQSYLEYGREPDYAVVVSVPRHAQLSRASKSATRRRPRQLKQQELVRLPIAQVYKAMSIALDNFNVDGVRVLSPEEATEFWSPSLRGASLAEVAELAEQYNIEMHHPKRGIYADRHSVAIDNQLYRAYRVTEMPRNIHPGSIAQLFTHTSVSVTVATQAEGTRAKKEGFFLYHIENILDALSEYLKLTKSAQIKRSRIDEASTNMAESEGIQFMNIYLLAHGDDPDTLAINGETLAREASGFGFTIEPVPGPLLQRKVALAATTGVVRV